MRPHIDPPGKRAPGRAATARPTAFVPGRIEQGISTLMLRRTHSRQIHAGASFAEMAPGLSPGLNGKEDAAVQHHSAMSAG